MDPKCFLVFVCLLIPQVHSWDADAGLVFGYEQSPSVSIYASSSGAATTPTSVIDGDSNSAWESAYCGNACCQYVMLDLGELKDIGFFIIRTWSDFINVTTIYGSADNTTWVELVQHSTGNFREISYALADSFQGRFVKVEQCVLPGEAGKAVIRELQVFDKNGPWGAHSAPDNFVNPHTFRSLIGVNGIWQWGGNGNSASVYSPICSHARNYHSLSWDIDSPSIQVNFTKWPTGQGSQGAWLNWDTEYSQWNSSFEEVDISIQFLNEGAFAVDQWPNPCQNAYNYGHEFAFHFGSTYGNGLVDYVEVGNEPWNYPADFYSQVLSGMIQGFKAGDPNIKVMPGALQGGGKETATSYMSDGGNYLGARLLEEHIPYIDIINVHAYSFMNSGSKTVATYPEDLRGGMNGVRNSLRWRDVNAPGKQVFLTEWGWDAESDFDTPDCPVGPYHNTCVSSEGSALYAMRAVLMFAREGLDKLTWFFYANGGTSPLFARSGLVSSKDTAFQKEKVFHSLERFLSYFEDLHFVGVLHEDARARSYLVGFPNGTETHLVAFRPVHVDDNGEGTVTVDGSRWAEPTSNSFVVLGGNEESTVQGAVTVNADSTWTLTITKELLLVPLTVLTPRTDSSSTSTDSTTATGSSTAGTSTNTGDDAESGSFKLFPLLLVVLLSVLCFP